MINSGKNCVARRIDVAARTVGVMMGIGGYATLFMVMAGVQSSLASIDAPLIFYLIPAVSSLVMGTGMGMGLAYVKSLWRLPDGMAWFGTVWDSFFASLFYLGWVAIPISFIWGPFAAVLSCSYFFPGLGYWIIVRLRSRRPAGDENNKD